MKKGGSAKRQRASGSNRGQRSAGRTRARQSNSGGSDSARKKYAFRLYVTGATARSSRAIRNLKDLCEKHFKGSCDVEIVDIYQQPALAQGQQIIAAPTLVKHFPLPLRKFIGDLSNTEHLIVEIKR